MKYHKKDECYVVKANGEWIKNAIAGITTINFDKAEIYKSETEALHFAAIFSKAKPDSEFVIQKLTTEETDPFSSESDFVKASKVIF